MGWLGSAEERARTLREAADIVRAYSADLERTPWDVCDCGHRRRDHIGGVGCTDENYCYPRDACKRFRRDDDWIGPERDDLVAWLRRLADRHEGVAGGGSA